MTAAPVVPRRIVATILLGTLLNPLNSSMIAVALVRLQRDFDVGLVTVTWAVSAFYLGGAVGQPLMGRLADLFGPRRMFCAGWVVVGLAGVLVPLAPTFGWLVAGRVVQALGTSAAFPAGLAILRRCAPAGTTPTGAMAAVAMAASLSAALGPVVGGALVVLIGWEAIFLVNGALALVGLPLALRLLPADPPGAARPAGRAGRLLERLDVPGVLLFTVALVGALAFLLSLGDAEPRWWLLAPTAAAALALVPRERRATAPFLALELVGNRGVLAVLLQFAAVNVVFYAAFFGVPQWLEEVRGLTPGEAGLILLPVTGLGLLTTPLCARLLARGMRPAVPLLVGSAGLAAGMAALLGVQEATPVALLLGVAAVLGIPTGLNNLGLQTLLYVRSPAEHTGAAGGLFQTARYVGSILATALLALAFGEVATTDGLHDVAAVGLAIGLALTLVSMTTLRSGAATRA